MRGSLKIKAAIMVFLLLFWSCKKYPENGREYVKPVNLRIKSHYWHFHALFVNGADSTLEHTAKFDPVNLDPHNIDIRFESMSKMVMHHPTTKLGYIEYYASFDHPKKNVLFNQRSSFLEFFIENKHNWAIKKLSNDDLILEEEINGVRYRFEFKY
jgi:hypothetical protein